MLRQLNWQKWDKHYALLGFRPNKKMTFIIKVQMIKAQEGRASFNKVRLELNPAWSHAKFLKSNKLNPQSIERKCCTLTPVLLETCNVFTLHKNVNFLKPSFPHSLPKGSLIKSTAKLNSLLSASAYPPNGSVPCSCDSTIIFSSASLMCKMTHFVRTS